MALEAYCVKCKEKREMLDPQAEFTASGAPGTRGKCPVSGTTMFRMGRTPAHEGMTPPENVVRRKKKEVKRKGNLVIVESPAKARTIGRFLGKDYRVEASVGHIRDLLRSQLSVDVDNDFKPKYRVPNEKRPIVKELKKLAASAEQIFLATDLDREGEAIAWHLMEAAEIDPERTRRVIFHEITKPAIEEAFSSSREIDMKLVDAQQARRILDRLVGYSLSPILWRKVRNRLSAGRVQSVALRIIVEREREIDDFDPVEFWSIGAELQPEGSEKTYLVKLNRIDGEKFELNNEEEVLPIISDLEGSAYSISKIKRGTRNRKPKAPYTTSTLQQEASRRLNFTARKTMSVAQQLYEGVDMGDGEPVGLITYMRTDSTNISKVAQEEARDYIKNIHGEPFLPEEPPNYKTRAKGAQEAHEAVRPTSVLRTPKAMKEFLSRDQYRLYQMIWQRFVASQMNPAIYDTLSVDVTAKSEAHEYLLRASGSIIKFMGYLAVYEETKGEFDKEENGDGAKIPENLTEGQIQKLIKMLPEQHFTQAPPRFSEATLVKALEEFGIGRPSTYAPTMSTLQNRGYVYRDGRRLHPTETGIIVNDLLTVHFPNIVDINFTANMEANLDKIAEGEIPWKKTIEEFYAPFAIQVEKAEIEMPEVKAEPEYVGRICPKCEEGQLMIRFGRYGKFISCDRFPDCRHTEPFLEKIGVTCPLDGGDVVMRRTRKGRIFFGCSNYPECEFTSWKRPIATPCPNCQGTLVIANKRDAECMKCEERFPLEEVNPETEEAEAQEA
ncbi:MAG: type I DNA topoisomerase [Chloroflexi bacterium]|nr:type I DNA topoisomerase [Chloroflexota bacterium]MBT3668865.1 type I DNA topoisomerase [Chloroflexota bacterium]MBT4002166.1 type I DNA topoisomerase [Chloroflexota bacterium]MBT4306579.1 type I DNA topoisomerase [Chloroflexota bacterium]MBT4533963.1 type I DNA topoisomerase [Chloroflexota bacterium]